MSTCPNDEYLALLIDEELEASAESDVAAHVQSCPACQMRLDEITRGRLAGIIELLPAAIGPDLRGYAPWRPIPPPDRPRAVDDASTALHSDDPTSVDRSRWQLPGPAAVGTAAGPGSCREDRGPTLDLGHDVPTEPGQTVDWPAGSGPAGSRDAGATTDHDPGDDDGSEIGLDAPRRDEGDTGGGRCDEFPRISGYEIRERLGQGGMGVVYKARQVGLNRLVAVKMIRGGSQARPEHFGRFRIEAEAVARLRHPNIIQIHDIGEAGGLPFVSLELLDGGDLGGRLAGNPQPGRAAAELLITLSEAMQLAHEAGIVHRDLKPTNILFTADGVPRITDFGLAKRLESDSHQTQSGQIMGSPSYMAPEQARGHAREVGPAADVYALGAILYEMLTGRPPFKGETPIETIRQVVDDEVVAPSRLVPKVPRDLETVALKCLNKEPSRRYESARALAEDLRRFLDGQPIKARRTPLWERGIKWARRRPLAATLLGIAIASGLGLTGGMVLDERSKRFAEERRNRDVQAYRDEGDSRIDKARGAASRSAGVSEEELTRHEVGLSTFREAIQKEERLRSLGGRLDDTLGLIKARQSQLRSLAAREALDRENRARFQTFLGLRDQAQLHAIGFGVAASDGLAKLRESAREAVATYAKDPQRPETDWALTDPLPTALSEAERVRVIDGCYDLLLLLSQAVEPAAGLRILDRAARLRPELTAAYHLRRADCLARSGDRPGRDRERDLAEQRPPVTALDHFLIGREHFQRRELTEAIISLDAAVRLDPDQTAAHLLLALCDYNVQPKRLNEARNSLGICIRAHPELTGLYLLRALFYGEEGNQILARIDPRRPDEEPGLRRQAAAAFEAAENDYDRALRRHPDDDYRYALLVNRGGMALQAGRLDRSRADLEEAIRLRPATYNAYAHLAQLDRRQGRLEAAYSGFSRAIDRTSDPAALATLFRNRAMLYADRKDLAPDRRAAAIRDLDEAIRREPNAGPEAADDHVSRARLLFGGRRHEEALEACGIAIRRVPDHAEAHRLRISALMALKRYEEVLRSCDAYLATKEATVEVLEMRGLARLAQEDFPGAIADFTRAIELRPGPSAEVEARLLNRRGWAWHFIDAPRPALADFEASLQLLEDQSDAHGGRGLARIRLGQWRPALADAEAAVRLALSSPTSDDEADARAQADFNAARIYAQAMEYAARDVGREGKSAVSLCRRYRARSLELLDRALRQIPDPARRREFLDDPALRPLRLAPDRPSPPRPSVSAPGRPTG
jgi:serine/threonine protein kinase